MAKRLTRRELRALAEAAAFRLAGDDGEVDVDALQSAHEKVSARGWPEGQEAER